MGPLLNFKDKIQRRNRRRDQKKKKNSIEFSQLREKKVLCVWKGMRKSSSPHHREHFRDAPRAHPWLSLPLGPAQRGEPQRHPDDFPKEMGCALKTASSWESRQGEGTSTKTPDPSPISTPQELLERTGGPPRRTAGLQGNKNVTNSICNIFKNLMYVVYFGKLDFYF